MNQIEGGVLRDIRVNRAQELARVALERTFRIGLNAEIQNKDKLTDAEKLLELGCGLLIIANHFSRQEAAGIFKIPFTNPVMLKRKIVYPVARHQKTVLNPLSRLGKCSPRYIVTEETVKRAERKFIRNPHRNISIPILNEGMREFMDELADTLKGGGISVIFPHGTRREQLYDPVTNPALSHLFAQMARKKINFGLLLVGVDIKGVTDYRKVRGVNIRKPYVYKIGNTYTSEEFLNMAGDKLRNVDEFALKELEGLVSRRYAGKSNSSQGLSKIF